MFAGEPGLPRAWKTNASRLRLFPNLKARPDCFWNRAGFPGSGVDENPIGLPLGEEFAIGFPYKPITSQRADAFHRGDPGDGLEAIPGKSRA